MIILVGASASGKTEVSKLLCAKYGFQKAITHTTRAPRKGEVNGVDYFFVTKEKFLELLTSCFFVEHTFYGGNYYGCGKDQISENKVVVVDPNGLKSFLALHNPRVVTFFLEASREEREERMRYRGDKEELIQKRLAFDEVEFSKGRIAKTDFVIPTSGRKLEEIAQEVYSSYQNELKKRTL